MKFHLSHRAVFWLLLVAGFAAFMQITSSDWWRSLYEEPQYDLYTWPIWTCNEANDRCQYKNAGVRLQMHKHPNKSRLITARMEPEFTHDVSSISFRRKGATSNMLEREFKFTRKSAHAWEITLPEQEMDLNGSKLYQIWITSSKKIFELQLKMSER